MYLIPKPQQCVRKDGIFLIKYDQKIVIDPSCKEEVYGYAGMLQAELEASAGFSPAITRGKSKKTAVTLSVVKGLLERNAYRLIVNRQGILIAGGSETGVLYGIQTLRQIIRQEGVCIPCLSIFDYPELPNRGLYYDVTRGRIPTLDYLKKLADKMVFYKMNQLQLYIEHSFLFEEESEVWRDDTPLTAEEILELDAYCRERKIELVPSLSSFGHLYKTLRTRTFRHLCELPDTGDQPFGFVDRMEHHTLDVSNEESLAFVKQRIEEYMPLFTSGYFNICSDETFDLGKGRSRELAEQKGTRRMYLDFVRQLCEFVVEKGKIPMFWGDIICGFPEAVKELPKETICLNWGYEPDQTEETTRILAGAGAVQYCCPGVCGWDLFINRLDYAYENIRRMCTYAVKYGCAGVLNTDWGDCGHINHPDFGMPGMIYGAAFSWNCKIPSFEEINRQISRIEYLDSSEKFVSLIAEISEHWVFQWRDLVNARENRKTIIETISGEELAARKEKETEALASVKKELCRIIPCLDTKKRSLIKPYLVAIDGMELVQEAGILLCGPEKMTKAEAYELAARMEEWFYHYKQVWRSVSRESELYRVEEVIFWCTDGLRKKGDGDISSLFLCAQNERKKSDRCAMI